MRSTVRLPNPQYRSAIPVTAGTPARVYSTTRSTGIPRVNAQELAAQIHQFRDPSPVADEFQQLRRDQRDAFGIIQPDTAGQALLRQEPGVVQ